MRIDSDSRDSDEISKNVFFAFSQAGTPVLQMTMDHVDLEDVFVELVEEEPEKKTETSGTSSEPEEEGLS